MRCCSCDKNLNDTESTRKSEVTNEYFDLCNKCFSTIADQLALPDLVEDHDESLIDESDEYDTNYKDFTSEE